MPWPIPTTEKRSREDLVRHYEVEKGLADRLRRAGRDERRHLYSEVYDALFREVDLPKLAHDPDAQRRVVELQAQALLPFLGEGATFLEIGAGDCALALHLCRRAGRVIAVEASAAAVADAQKPEGFELVLSDAIPLDLPDRSVDLAYSCHFLEHLHPDDAAEHAAEVRRVLVPGGAYVVITPNRLWGPHDVSRYFDDVPTGLHLREYTHADLVRLLAAAGFRRARVLSGVGVAPRAVAAWPVAAVEAVLGVLPPAWRRRLLGRLFARRPPPFRPLEQVKVVAWT